jgi:hypothetical protein
LEPTPRLELGTCGLRILAGRLHSAAYDCICRQIDGSRTKIVAPSCAEAHQDQGLDQNRDQSSEDWDQGLREDGGGSTRRLHASAFGGSIIVARDGESPSCSLGDGSVRTPVYRLIGHRRESLSGCQPRWLSKYPTRLPAPTEARADPWRAFLGCASPMHYERR